MGRVKPRLYRVIGTKENADDGTFEVSGILHDPKKYTSVDNRARFDSDVTTLHGIAPKLTLPELRSDGDKLVISWENLTADGSVLSYDIKIYRDNKLYRHIPDSQTAEIALENLPNGQYRAEIRGRNTRGVLSEPIEKGWSVDYTIRGVRTTAKMNAVQLDWYLPDTVMKNVASEIWLARENNRAAASKLATIAYPQTTYTLLGVSLTETLYFWVRIIDSAGNTGEFSDVAIGRADPDPAPILAQLNGKISKAELTKELFELVSESKEFSEEDKKKITAQIKKEVQSLDLNDSTVQEVKKIARDFEGNVKSLYTLKTQAFGNNRRAISGIAVGADSKTAEGHILMMADKVMFVDPNSNQIVPALLVEVKDGRAVMGLNGDLISDGMIHGRHIVAGTKIVSPRIEGGSMSIGDGRFTVSNDGEVQIASAKANVGMKISNDRIDVYDEQGVLRVRLGKLN